MKSNNIPEPTVMPVNREAWFKQLNLSNFVNTYYQYRDLQLCQDCKKILIIGSGQGLDAHVLKWRGYEVTTFDIDDTFKPDYRGSVHDMSVFMDGQFDAVIASHVLEHLPVPYLDKALHEIARIGRYSIIYLPVAGRHGQIRFMLGLHNIGFSFIWDIFNYLHMPDGITPRYCAGQHFWEIGMRGYRVKNIITRMSKFYNIISMYRNKDWLPSQNFVLKSKLTKL